MTRSEKQAVVAELIEQLGSIGATVITGYRGTSVGKMDDLRRRLDQLGIRFKVAKNSLLKRAFVELGVGVGDSAILDEPIALAWGKTDPALLAKAISDAGREIETIVPRGGIIDGGFVDAEVVTRLAMLPSRHQQYGQIVGGLASLPIRMARSIANPMGQVVAVLRQITIRKEA